MPAPIKFEEKHIKLFGVVADTEIAKLAKCSDSAIRRARIKLNIPSAGVRNRGVCVDSRGRPWAALLRRQEYDRNRADSALLNYPRPAGLAEHLAELRK